MRFTIAVPHPFARLTHILAVMERGRIAENPPTLSQPVSPEPCDDDIFGLAASSLACCEDPDQPKGDVLRDISLEGGAKAPDSHDYLSEMGMLRTHHHRPVL